MPLVPGDKLGSYEIDSLLGKGGMGEVWKARDSQLGRDVAIKVSAQQFTDRFEREARAIAALNHPNVCTLYHIGPNYLVMEYIEGPTLAERIKEGPIPLEEALGIAKQIAAALEAAHEKPIVHRDLKPANVKIRPDGSVKVLDFGLATAAGEEKEFGPDSPTMLTAGGMILGTAGYMSPEQARGKKVDKRADIWAFGVVLYEMVTGKRLFEGETVSDSLAAIIKEEPDLSGVPAQVRPLLKRCLEKDPNKRLRDIGDAMPLLDVGQVPNLPQQAGSLLHKGWIAAVAVLALVAAGLGFRLYRATRPIEQPLKPLVRLDVDLGADVPPRTLNGGELILSPDGTRLVYVSQGKLFTRRMDQSRTVELAGTEGAFAPFFSPDGKWVAFFTQSNLKKISVEGGAAVALCVAVNPRGGSWGEDGTIIAALTNNIATLFNTGGVLSRIPSAGGAPTPVTELAQGEVTHRWPQILPGGKSVLFTSNTLTNYDNANIEVMSLADHRRKTLVRGGTFGRYLPGSNGTGYLVYINKGTLFAMPFDPNKLEARGAPSPVLEEVAYSTVNGFGQFDFSRNGTLVYRSGRAAGGNLVTVQWLDAAGKTEPLLAKPGAWQRPRLSPDGQRLALDDGTDIWVYEARRDTKTRLTFGGGANIGPVWSPDGRYIAFQGPGGIWWVRSDGAGKPQLLIQNKNPLYPWSFTPDGKRLAYYENNPRTAYDIWAAAIESDGVGLRAGKPESFLQTSAEERQPAFSPDGRWLAYISDESGAYQVYVRAFPDKGGKWQISNEGARFPVWSGNGHELFFRTQDNRIMVATYAAKADSFVPDKPRVWSDRQLANLGNFVGNYDLAPDGKRIAALIPVETAEAQQTQNHVIFLMNFADELQRKVPVGK
jgi:serine/threonine-protein kinase